LYNSTTSCNHFPLLADENKQRINQATNKHRNSSQQFTHPKSHLRKFATTIPKLEKYLFNAAASIHRILEIKLNHENRESLHGSI